MSKTEPSEAGPLKTDKCDEYDFANKSNVEQIAPGVFQRSPDKGKRDWHPIETAPKDTAVLTYGFGYEVARHDTNFGWVAVWDNRAIREPVAWMPLPAPPQDSGNR